MVSAIVLINSERGKTQEISSTLADIDGITEVFSVAGRYDIVALLRVGSNDQLADLVAREVGSIQGILHTETLFSFQVFSKYDMEAMFSIGN